MSKKKWGTKSVDEEETQRKEPFLANHLFNIHRAFNEKLSEDNVESFDETHIIFDVTDGSMLAICGENNFTYTELRGETNGFTIEVGLSEV